MCCAACGASSESSDAGSLDASADVLATDAAEAGTIACPSPFDVQRPDAGGFCCCNFDEVSTPTCQADGTLSCPASSQLYSGFDCLGVHCTNPSHLGGGAVDASGCEAGGDCDSGEEFDFGACACVPIRGAE